MIRELIDLPENVVGLEAVGEVTADDYETVVIPLLDAAHERFERIRCLYHAGPEFAGFTLGGLLDDARTGLRHFAHVEKVAVVTDRDWVATATRALGFLVPGEVRVFPDSGLEEAKRWVIS